MAVVISLIYVGISVQQNTDAVKVANHQALVAMDMNKNTWLRDADFAAVYETARSDMEKLTQAERRQYLTFVADTMNAWEFAFITYNNGAIADTIWNGWDGFYRTEFESTAFQYFWSEQDGNFSPAFTSYLDEL